MRKEFIIILLVLCAFASVSAAEIALTVYNDDLALVKDVRELVLKKGTNDLKFVDVAAQIDPTSVHFQSLTALDKVALLEQNYEYDLVSASKMLEKYVDEDIRIFAKDDKVFEGTLLSASGGDFVLKSRDGGIRVIRSKAIEGMEFPDLPEGLITRPTLIWSVDCKQAGTHRTEVSYLTTGIQWHAEYVAVTNRDDSALDLSGWVSIDNRSGATYKDAKLKLVAGTVHRVEEPRPMRARRMALMAMEKAAEAPFEERAFFEYHLYTLSRRATVKDQQIKQLSLFPNAHVAVKKVYSYDGARDQKKVKVKLEFKNSKDAGLGLALPKGKVRVYKRDVDEALEFIGEDRIDHTPKDEEVRLILGDAFDVVGERKVTEHRKISDRVSEETVEIVLRNHKEEAITVLVIEHLWGDWEILESSMDYRKKDARTIEFDVPVEKDGEAKVEYRVRVVR